MKLTKYLAVLCCGTLFAACENPIQDDLNVDNPENYTRIYTVNAVDDASKNTLSFPLERDTSLMVYANLSGIRNPGCDVTVKFRVAPELVDTYNQKHQSNYPMMLDGSYTIENLEAVIPNGKYISSPIRIAINSQAFDGVGVFLLPVRIENVTPDLAVNESLQTAYLRINGYYTENPFPRYDRSGWSIAGFSTQEAEATSTYPNRGLAVSIIDGETTPIGVRSGATPNPARRTGSPSTWAHPRNCTDSRSADGLTKKAPTFPRAAATRVSSTST